MRKSECFVPALFVLVTGFVLLVGVFMSSGAVSAKNGDHARTGVKCLGADTKACEVAIAANSEYRKLDKTERIKFDRGDRLAALRSVQYALSNIGDGASYLWTRGNGRISSVVHPTGSFKDATGQVCRHVEVKFISGPVAKSIETIACRRYSGVWEISG